MTSPRGGDPFAQLPNRRLRCVATKNCEDLPRLKGMTD